MGQLEEIWSDARAEVHQIVVGPMDNNVYILRCKRSGEAMLIDAANEHEALLPICRNLGVNQVVETHGHWDHIQAVPAVRDAGISVAVTSADAGMLPSYDLILDDDETLKVGDVRIRTLATPGHTPGSICFAVEGTNLLFTRRHAFPGRPGQHLVRGRRLRHHHHLHRPPDLRRLPDRHPRPARPRHGNHGGRGIAPPAGMGRSRLVRPATARRGPENPTKTVSFR